jgi:hypothetical protein
MSDPSLSLLSTRRPGRAIAIAASLLLHGALLPMVLNHSARAAMEPRSRLFAHYRVQVVQLAPDIGRPGPIPYPRTRNRARAGSTQSPAPQTLVVRDAPPGLILDRAIPLPLVLSWTEFKQPPPHPEQPQQIDIVSLPDRVNQVDNAVTVPKVNQVAAGHESGDGQASGGGENFTRIDLPPNARPPLSVLGESVVNQYPEITGLGLSGRVVSTVYLNIGLKKSWALEYWLLAGSAPDAAKGGAAMPEAPWPRTMLRPIDLRLPPYADAVLVHGVLTAQGQLEQLTLILPPDWPQKEILLQALQLWKFRPAMKDGEAVAVEIMLVIPRQPEE